MAKSVNYNFEPKLYNQTVNKDKWVVTNKDRMFQDMAFDAKNSDNQVKDGWNDYP